MLGRGRRGLGTGRDDFATFLGDQDRFIDYKFPYGSDQMKIESQAARRKSSTVSRGDLIEAIEHRRRGERLQGDFHFLFWSKFPENLYVMQLLIPPLLQELLCRSGGLHAAQGR